MKRTEQTPVYEIVIESALGKSAANWFEGFSLETTRDGHTIVRGPVVDQSALQGLLNRLSDFGLTLTSVRRVKTRGGLVKKQKRGARVMMIVAIAVAALLIALFGTLWLISPGNVSHLTDENGSVVAGSISEKIWIPVNGSEQGLVIVGHDTTNPVLLFVHGGPGMPEYWLSKRYDPGLEEHFTVAWWDQRGAGLSFSPDIDPPTMNAEQFVADAIAVSRYLIERFGHERIYLMGHSWGSYIGIQTVAAAPELYHAYIGIGQVTHQIESERIAYDYALAEYRRRDDERMVAKLNAAPPSNVGPLPREYERLRDAYMHGIGIGTTGEMESVITGILLPSLRFPEYTLCEKLNLWRGKVQSRSPEYALWEPMLVTDLRTAVPKLEVPAYFFHGRYDYTCAYPLALDYYESIEAPAKGFYTFGDSAHTPVFEEPEKALSVLIDDVLNATTLGADHALQERT